MAPSELTPLPGPTAETVNPGDPIPIGQPLDTVTRLKLVRNIVDRTCIETGAGYLLIMFVPGSDMMLRSFRGLDSPEECIAAAAEVAGMLRPHVERLTGAAPKPKMNDV